MTLVFLEYPIVIIPFVLCALLAVLTGRSRRHNMALFLLTGLFAAATVILSLICSVPMAEILLLLLILSLIGCLCTRKEGEK